MEFNDWWRESWAKLFHEIDSTKGVSEAAWNASRENQQEFELKEFCKDVKCAKLNEDGSCGEYSSCAFDPFLLRWLKHNGYRIVKEE